MICGCSLSLSHQAIQAVRVQVPLQAGQVMVLRLVSSWPVPRHVMHGSWSLCAFMC